MYDLIILGGGSAAFAAAYAANKLKKKTLLINDGKILSIGGTCVNVGCIPSKIMLHQGEIYFYSVRNGFNAIKLKGRANFIKALKETYRMVKKLRKKNYEEVIKRLEYVDFEEGFAYFSDPNTVNVGNKSFKGKYFLIATGASTFIPPIKGIDKIDFITNSNIFNLRKKPKSIIIIGGGPLGMEFSQIFNHFGIEVTVLQRSERIIPGFDSSLSKELKKYLKKEGIKIYTNANTKEVIKKKGEVEVVVEINGKRKVLTAERLMLATGLKPRTEFKPEKAGVELNEKGFVKINEFMQTSQKHIYAAGDITGIMPLETIAAKQGYLAVLNMFENANKKIDYNEVPHVVFTSPQVASVGLTEEEAIKKYGKCLCRVLTLDYVEKALAIKDTRGLIKMIVDPETKIIIGIHIISPIASEIITAATYAIKSKMTIYDIGDTVHVFPTLSDMMKKVAQSFYENLDQMACCVG